MRKHNGMRPQDIPILLKIVAKGEKLWQNKDLASELYISGSEISESLHRSSVGGLIDAENKKKVYRQSLMEFLEFGLHHVFPAEPGTIVNGMYTAHSHPRMQKEFKGDRQEHLHYVWPDARGKYRGLKIDPLWKDQVRAAQQDEKLYYMLALVDVIRVGQVREVKFAIEELKSLILWNTFMKI